MDNDDKYYPGLSSVTETVRKETELSASLDTVAAPANIKYFIDCASIVTNATVGVDNYHTVNLTLSMYSRPLSGISTIIVDWAQFLPIIPIFRYCTQLTELRMSLPIFKKGIECEIVCLTGWTISPTSALVI